MGGNVAEGGFYRIVSDDVDAFGDPVAVAFSYQLDYYNWQYNYYDRAGRMKAEVQPIGIGENGTITNPDMIATFDYHSWYAEQGDSPDAGLQQYRYTVDGRLKISQDAQQSLDGVYSYTEFDPSSLRVIEMGEISGSFSGADPDGTLSGTRTDQTYIAYDLPDEGLAADISSCRTARRPIPTNLPTRHGFQDLE